MKKFLFLLFLFPSIVSADDIFNFKKGNPLNEQPQKYLDISATTTVGYRWASKNLSTATGYAQLQLWFDEYNEQVCDSVEGPIALNSDTGDIESNFSTIGRDSFEEADIVWSSANTVDGNGCLSGTITESIYFDSNSNSPSLIFGLPSSGGATTTEYIVGSTTSSVTNNPTLDWFLGFLIFFVCMIFPIWLFRRK